MQLARYIDHCSSMKVMKMTACTNHDDGIKILIDFLNALLFKLNTYKNNFFFSEFKHRVEFLTRVKNQLIK